MTFSQWKTIGIENGWILTRNPLTQAQPIEERAANIVKNYIRKNRV